MIRVEAMKQSAMPSPKRPRIERIMNALSEWHLLARPNKERLIDNNKNIEMRELSLPKVSINGFEKKRPQMNPILMELKLSQFTRK